MPNSAESRRVLRGFAALSFCYFAYAGLFGTYAPLWFESLGFGSFAIGVLAAVQSTTRIVGPYAWAALADHHGRRLKWLRLSCALCLLLASGLLFARDFLGVALVVAALFLATSAVVPLSEAALAAWLSRESELDTGRYGRVRLWGSVGFIASVLLAGWVLDHLQLSHSLTFPLMVLLLLAALLVSARRLRVDEEAVAKSQDGQAQGAWAILCKPEVAWFFTGVFFTVLAHVALYAFFSLYLVQHGHSQTMVGIIWAVGVMAEIAWFALQGRWIHLLHMHTWLVLAAMAAALRFVGIAAWGEHLLMLMLLQLTHALTFAAQHTACISVVSSHFQGHLRGRGQALYGVLGYGLSGVLGGVLGGWLSDHLGLESVFWAASVCALLGAASAWQARRAQQLA
jgi:PPP family 3-phenylpropionic acid transporter